MSIVVGFLLQPFVLYTLGRDMFGSWQVVVSLTALYGLLDLGVRSAVGQYMTRYLAKNDLNGVNETVNTSLGITATIGTLLVFVTISSSFIAPAVIESSIDENTMRSLILIMGIGVALNFPLAVFGGAIFAKQRFDIGNGIAITERIVNALLYVVVLRNDGGLIGIAIVTATTPLVANCVRMVIAFRLVPGMTLSRRLIKADSLRQILHYGVFAAISTAAELIVIHSDALIVGAELGDRAVTYYAMGSYVIAQSMGLINAVAWVLTPYATSCDSQGDHAALQRLWMTGTRVIMIFGGLIAAGAVFLGRDFLTLWVPDSEQGIVLGEEYASAVTIMCILSATVLIRAAMACGKQILYGLREVKFLARNAVITSLLNVVLSLILIQWFGLIGVAAASVTAFAVAQLWVQPRYLAKRIDVSFGEFVRPTLWIATLLFGSMGALEWALHDVIPVDSWGDFVLKGFAISTPSALLAMWLGTTHVEKDKVRAFVRRMRGGRDPFTGKG